MIDLIYTAANNARLLALCEQANWLAGFRSDKYPVASATSIQFIDVRYTSPNFARHLELVKRFRPLYAIVPDLSEQAVSREDVKRALCQAETLAPYCNTTFIVPKLSGQLELLPKDQPIGYSVPSRYGGAHYVLQELAGRQVHLLGGSPHQQLILYRYISCYATIKSVDGNMFQRMSGYGKYWYRGRWLKHPAHGQGACISYDCVARSLHNIRQAWLSLFDHSRCPCCGDGLGLNKWCVLCQDARSSIPDDPSKCYSGTIRHR